MRGVLLLIFLMNRIIYQISDLRVEEGFLSIKQ